MKTKKIDKLIDKDKRIKTFEHRLKEDYEGNDEKITIEDYTGKMMT